MLSKAVTICDDVAWCEVCHDEQHADDIAFIHGLMSRVGESEFTLAKGVIFWTPPASLDDVPVYGRWAQVRSDQAAAVRAITVHDVRVLLSDDSIEGIVDAI